MLTYSEIQKILGKDAAGLLGHKCKTIPKEDLHIPGPKFIEKVFSLSDRKRKVIHNLKKMRDAGRLKGTGYYSILPVDQGIEHSAGESFSQNPDYFDPENIVKLALEAKCNAVASTLGTLGIVSKKYADKIPFIVKINHNDLLRYPNDYDEAMFADVQQAYDMGAVAIGATIYFGSKESKRQISEVSEAFAEAHRLGMFTILWCYVRNSAFKVGGKDYNESADLTGQANYLGATIEADIVKQKLPSLNGGYLVLNKDGHNFGKYDELMYSKLSTDHPIDLCRYQVANCFMGRVGMISSGGASGKNDLKDAVYTAVVNKRAGGSGLILGRKAFKKSMEEGVKIIQTVQDVYACDEITIA
ncbi:MAG: fructose-bisphosphate aldolase [Candidatus Magasanikbacteria bacterium RIFOXYC2_FULL_40_16]|uniref:fructose-bisphosphate aldolase n=3 Tax=Candidatus Magasanikiibacteriota TaxID=1752731 RepID=A0A1F6NDT0_9BACT|nr:MAG: fructose-bisphosphate aldolase [Candidatus Magasanikbacteria bacterium RIFOXYA2_FULL_40_20]OGH82055.1 MAG: fructose-bisphosphate aldolase [Candidatus Magasanikbacteria bacterium RIFOXYB1_FULL_40_15]OGH85070.1 MAG: fructose-bisphosphate aldolase [Candidatus Magasanikbacteria bacterium RIFOXYB2_FULL_40_13]OGH87673.1 MAG: fructose-bisphosphate aldolase [Candidatus Magasanikbacteria bacterium RIFOXYA1_FULL_40_8]OGH90252.1 MAG: fructose-bisphosphate aldolase [Candidatus Magasanikbacteria bac